MKIKTVFIKKLGFTIFLSIPVLLLAQNRPVSDTAGNGTKAITQKPSAGPKPYREVITAKAKPMTVYLKCINWKIATFRDTRFYTGS
jgi:hypothetical protein